MIKTQLATIFTLSTALVLTGNVSAHEKEWVDDLQFERVGYFDDVDADENGKVSRDEYLEYNKDSRRYDKDWRENHWDEMVEKFDNNDDNQITKAEVEDYVDERMAEVADRLKNIEIFGEKFEFDFDDHHAFGRFDDEEFGERLAEKMDRVQERVAKALEHLDDLDIHEMDHDRVFRFRSSPSIEIKRGPLWVERSMDENDDGKISKEEFLSKRQDLFEELDKNNDGILDEEELEENSFGGYAFFWDEEDEEDEDQE